MIGFSLLLKISQTRILTCCSRRLHVWSQATRRRLIQTRNGLIARWRRRWQIGGRNSYKMLSLLRIEQHRHPVERASIVQLPVKGMPLLIVLYVDFCQGCCCKDLTAPAMHLHRHPVCRIRKFCIGCVHWFAEERFDA